MSEQPEGKAPDNVSTANDSTLNIVQLYGDMVGHFEDFPSFRLRQNEFRGSSYVSVDTKDGSWAKISLAENEWVYSSFKRAFHSVAVHSRSQLMKLLCEDFPSVK